MEIAEENKAKIHCTVPKWARGTWGGVGTNVADMIDIVLTLRRAPLHGWSLSSNPKSLTLSACRLCFSHCDYGILVSITSVRVHSKMWIAKSLYYN